MKRSLVQLASLLALRGNVAAQDLPYNPTRVYVSSNGSSAYIFQPSAQSSTPGQSRLLSLDLGSPISTSQTPFTTISDTLPFLQDSELLPFTPTIDDTGNITVVAGNCSQGANGTQVWRFELGTGSSQGSEAWSQYQTADDDLGSYVTLGGSNYLANGIAFSEYVDSDAADTNIFVFGGMCPLANSTADKWTSAAAYSNQMLTLSPNFGAGYRDYEISLVANRGPPIAEAGFSITALSPTYPKNSSGEPQTQQQDFVLLGGHTQSAFINMSQVALFSLPQESWAFLPVAQPSGAKTDLAARQAQTEVEPRSGHTAVLMGDGSSVLLFGGWVGDVNTPAQPQLAVLQFGIGYGGSGEWSWSIPTQSGSGLAAGTGIYGHGAAMLPGGVMMIVGGYSIPPATSSVRFRRDAQSANTGFLLYNTTSNTWIDTYTPPSSLAQEPDKASGLLSKESQQIGLGVGLGVGAIILLALLWFLWWYNKRLQRAREARGRTLLSRSSDGSLIGAQADQPFLNNGGIDGRGGDAAAVGRFWNVWDHRTGAYPSRQLEMEQQAGVAGSTGLFVDAPSPTRGLRKAPAGKNYQYQAAPRYDDQRMSRGSGNIHPIVEREDEDSSVAGREDDGLTDAEMRLKELERVLTAIDPFTDGGPNPLGSHPVSPELGDMTVRRVPTEGRRMSQTPRPTSISHADARNWTSQREQAGPLLQIDTGRVSPTKSEERTSSTLSETSQQSGHSITRTMSTRTGAILAAAAAARSNSNSSPEHSSGDNRTRTMSTNGGRKSPFYYQTRARSSTIGSVKEGPPSSASTDGDSFMTAHTNSTELQSQGEALLGGRPMMDRDDPYQRAMAAHSSTRESATSPSYDDGPLPAIPRRRQGWMGSLRRALNAVGERSFSMTGASERYADEQRSATPSPTKDPRKPIGSAPRRTVSDGGALLRQKRGRRDWEDAQWPRYRDDPDPGDWGEVAASPVEKPEADEDWDVEGAASKRDFQIMFTVPKARLRVVNADMDRASIRSASEGALSRAGSFKQLRHEESARTLRGRPEVDRLLLSSTMEEEQEDVASGSSPEELLMWDTKEKAA
ncbi:hypothetical protein LTR08_003456 [Meristemomyces frigidus]|nr:hypothetical protein LTR08_003456 [Meristemomyces frigidus]